MNTKKELHTKETAGLTGKDLLTAMNYLEEEIVELQPQKAKKTVKIFGAQRTVGTVVKWAAAAAFALCFVSSSIVFAASKLNFSFLKDQDADGRDRYKLEYIVDRIPAEELTGEIQQVKEQFMAEAANGIYSEPRGFVKSFASEKEALDYIGYDKIRETMLDVGELMVEPGVAVRGDKDGNLTRVICFTTRKIQLQTEENEQIFFAQESEINTTDYPYDFTGIINSNYNDKDKVQKYEYVTKSGNSALILLLDTYEGRGGQVRVDGYVVEGAVVYSLSINYSSLGEKHTEPVEALMKQWLEQF